MSSDRSSDVGSKNGPSLLRATAPPNDKARNQRLTLIRKNNIEKNYCYNAKTNKPQLFFLCLAFLIGVWGFLGTLMLIEVQHTVAVENNQGSPGGSGSRGTIVSNLRPLKQENNKNAASKFQLVSEDAPECHELASPDDITLTLVTQVSHDRLWMMRHHCERYKYKHRLGVKEHHKPWLQKQLQHRMSIAVYSNATLNEIRNELREMDCFVNDNENDESGPPAGLDVSVLDARTHGAWNDYPVNELRNLALSSVRTTHILYIDVDFWPSEHLYEVIMGDGSGSGSSSKEKAAKKDIRTALFEDPKLALVIPAFQLWRQCGQWVDCQEANLPHMDAALTAEGLFQEIKNHRSITIFDPTNRGGHGSTDYRSWVRQDVGSLLPIDCIQSNRYEPFLMVRYCKDLPPFQTGFAGYGKNKVTWMMQVIASGYVFSQVGGVFLLHYPHLDSASRQHWNDGNKKKDSILNGSTNEGGDGETISTNLQDYKRGKIDKLFVDFREWLREAIPSTAQRLKSCEDAQDDDSKLWVENNKNAKPHTGPQRTTERRTS